MLHQRLQPVQAIAQRRDMQRQHVEPVIQILAKLATGTQLGQVDLGGTHHPHIEIDLFITADPAKAAVLQEAQQLDLQARAHFTHAIKKQRTPGRQLQQAQLAFGPRPFKCTRAVAEQLGFSHRFGQACAVKRHQWRLATRAGQMAGTGQQLLAGAGFTFY